MQLTPEPTHALAADATRAARLRRHAQRSSDAYDRAELGSLQWARARRWLQLWTAALRREESRARTIDYCALQLTALICKAAREGLDERDIRRAGLVLNAAASAGEP